MADFIGYGILAPMPLWVFLYIIYLMWAEAEYGMKCERCNQRHHSLRCPGPDEAEKEVSSPWWPLVLLFSIGVVVVFVVQFTPY